jgi:methionine--tRNA ligase beta chain
MINIDDFLKIEIKVGKILEAKKLEGSDKLLKILVDIGEESPRQILSGIAEVTPDPETLVGKEIAVITNLVPRQMRGETSYGMLLAASSEEGPVLLHPAREVKPGSVVK